MDKAMKPMMKARTILKKRRGDEGLTLIELMIAMLILAVGLGALVGLFMIAMLTNNKNSKDTTATMLAQTVLEHIDANSASASNTGSPVITHFSITDCTGTTSWVSLIAGGAGMANLTAGTAFSPGGNVDWTQAANAITLAPTGAADPGAGYGYRFNYTACGPGGQQTTYEVRVNILNVQWPGTNAPSPNLHVVTTSARQVGNVTGQVGGLAYAVPITLRALRGSS